MTEKVRTRAEPDRGITLQPLRPPSRLTRDQPENSVIQI